MPSLREKIYGKFKPLVERIDDIKSALKEVYSDDKPVSQPQNMMASASAAAPVKSDPPMPREEVGSIPPPEALDVVDRNIEPTDVYNVQDRGVSIQKNEIEEVLKPMLYSEVASYMDRPKDKIDLEVRTVLNTVLNRMKNQGKPMKDIIMAPNQYQGVTSPKFKNYATTTDEAERKQIELINEIVDGVLEEIQRGEFEDNITGAPFYGHAKDGTIRAFDTWEQYKAAIKAGKIK